MWQVQYYDPDKETSVIFGIYFELDQAVRVQEYMNRVSYLNYWVFDIENNRDVA